MEPDPIWLIFWTFLNGLIGFFIFNSILWWFALRIKKGFFDDIAIWLGAWVGASSFLSLFKIILFFNWSFVEEIILYFIFYSLVPDIREVASPEIWDIHNKDN
ncbi:MAG: hypothetical protein ACQ9MH_10330 [Nitrospinales bacterium]